MLKNWQVPIIREKKTQRNFQILKDLIPHHSDQDIVDFMKKITDNFFKRLEEKKIKSHDLVITYATDFKKTKAPINLLSTIVNCLEDDLVYFFKETEIQPTDSKTFTSEGRVNITKTLQEKYNMTPEEFFKKHNLGTVRK